MSATAKYRELQSVHSAGFPTTSWTEVLAAGGQSQGSQEALAALCGKYWYPVYAYVRRCGRRAEEAKDLTQAFFARAIEQHYLESARRERGKFRSFLLASVKHFLANEWDAAQARKRGGGLHFVSLDFTSAEGRYRLEAADQLTPERLFERRWALAVLEGVLGRLRQEFEQKGRGEQFEKLKGFLSGEYPRGSYRQRAGELHVSESALKVAVHRLRLRYGELLREEIASTVGDASQVEEEVRYLSAALSPP